MKTEHKWMNKTTVALLMLLIILVPIVLMPSIAFAESTDDEEAGFGEKMVSELVRGFGKGIELLFLRDPSNQIDSVVYNDGRSDFGLTLLKGGKLATFFFEFYMIFQYIAGAMLAPIVIWIAVYFPRAGDNAQKKAELKDKLVRVFITVILLISMPAIIDMFLNINNAAVDIFKGVLKSKVLGVNDLKEGLLMKEFYEQAEDSGKLAENLAYLMTVFLNLWFVIYYFIRDISIAYLFMLYPIMAVMYPIKKGAVMDWYKQMASNVFTQAIHALFLTVGLGIAYIPEEPNLLFALTGMAIIIPATGKLKRRFSLEGDIGGASSMAGVGLMMGAYQMTRDVVGDVKKGVGTVKEGFGQSRDAKADMNLLRKGHTRDGSSDLSQSLPSTNNGGKTLAMDELKGQKRLGRQKMLKGVGGVVGSVGLGALTGAGMSVFGGRAAMAGFGTGALIGKEAGSFLGNQAGGAMNFAGAHFEEADEVTHSGIMQGITSDEARKERYGLNDPLIEGTEYQKNEVKARKKLSIYTAMGKPDVGKAKFAKHTNPKYSADELKNIDGVKMYQSDKMSAFYRQNRDGGIDVFSTWEGNKKLEGKKPLTYDVGFNDGNFELGKPTEFTSLNENYNLDTVKDLNNVDENKLIDITNGTNAMEQGPIEDGVGIVNVSKSGSSVYKLNSATDKMSLVGTGAGDSFLPSGKIMQTGVKFKEGKILADQIRHAVEKANTENMVDEEIANYDKSHVPQNVSSNAQAEDIIEVTITEEDGQAHQNFVNITSNQFMGRQSVSNDVGQNQINTTTRVIVNKQGNWQQMGQAQPTTTANMHNIIHSQSVVPYEVQKSYELGHQKNQIMNAINEMRSVYEMPEVNIEREITDAM